jgi:diacylglycerol kinase (ATP)
MKRAWLVFNPACGKGEGDDRATIVACLRARFDVVVRETSRRVGADVWARRALESGADVVVAAGGDGTVSAVAEALIGTGVPLGVIPRGTANALSAALGLPADVEGACASIATTRR